jgi:hypothetical protein
MMSKSSEHGPSSAMNRLAFDVSSTEAITIRVFGQNHGSESGRHADCIC